MDLSNIDSILSNVLSLLTIPKPKDPEVPSLLVLASSNRSGLSAQKMAAEVIRRRPEAGLPVGAFPDGQINPDEMLELIRFEVLINALASEARTTVAIQPGIPILAQGTTAGGTPIIIQGLTTGLGKGNAIIQ